MAQAESDPTTFAAFATFLGTPLPENPIRALRILRKEAAAEIERLIAFLDALGGDPDLEDGHDDEADIDEPSLGWTTTINQAARTEQRFGSQWDYDTEQEHDGSEPDVDDEEGGDDKPSLGFLNSGVRQQGPVFDNEDVEEG
jgi:hypothetical protein